MKKLLLSCLVVTMFTSLLQAQDDTNFTRQGKWLIETGLGTFGLLGNSTGASFIFPEEGGSVGVLSFEGGKFISDDLAWLAKFSYLNADGGVSLTTIGAGLKYYAGGNIPIKVGGGAGITSASFGGSSTDFIGNASVGYAARLADNILLEPNVRIFYSGGAAFTIGLTFALVL